MEESCDIIKVDQHSKSLLAEAGAHALHMGLIPSTTWFPEFSCKCYQAQVWSSNTKTNPNKWKSSQAHCSGCLGEIVIFREALHNLECMAEGLYASFGHKALGEKMLSSCLFWDVTLCINSCTEAKWLVGGTSIYPVIHWAGEIGGKTHVLHSVNHSLIPSIEYSPWGQSQE